MIFLLRHLKSLFFSKNDKKIFNNVGKLLCIIPQNIILYKVAFQYKKPDGENFSNERLEFLGDAALSLIIGDYLFKKYPQQDEGFLTDVRARIVNRETLGLLANKMGIQYLLKFDSSYGKSRHTSGNTLEALIGAVYLDLGYKKCYKVVMHMFMNYADLEYIINTDKNFKSSIYEWANKNQKEIEISILERFEVEDKLFYRAQVLIDGISICLGEGRGKKEAEQNASRKAIEFVQSHDFEANLATLIEIDRTTNIPTSEILNQENLNQESNSYADGEEKENAT